MTTTRTVISATLLILIAGQTGCSRSEDSKNAVREAGREFEMIAAGNANSSPSNAESALLKAESTVSKYAGSKDGYAQAASLGVAQAKIGLSALASQEAVAAERTSMLQARVIRGYLNEWRTMSAIAEAANIFDPTEGLKELADLITMRQEDIGTYRTLKDEIEGEISQLNTKIGDLENNASTERTAGAEIELRIPTLSAEEGARLAVQVREHTLRGDQFGLEAFRMQGRVDQLIPTREEYSLNVKKAESQIELLDAAREELQDRERTSKSDAKDARAKAQVSQDAILKLIDALDEHRSSTVQSSNTKAISLVRGAISATRDSKKATASVASLTKGSAMQLLGECLLRQAWGHGEAATIYINIAEAGIPGDWVAKAESERETQASLKAEASQSFRDAASALRGARISGEAGDKLEAAAARLDLLGGFVPEPVEEYDDSDDYIDDTFDESDESMGMDDETEIDPEEDDG
ncbi:MAG: hypothetical protein JKY96_05895 [Phycisphaerales bacterium]|nr:hypothetical protein [Phycisphaerales bacterium]